MNIPDNSENDFKNNINLYVLYHLHDRNAVFESILIISGRRCHFIKDIFQSSLREFLFPDLTFYEAYKIPY